MCLYCKVGMKICDKGSIMNDFKGQSFGCYCLGPSLPLKGRTVVSFTLEALILCQKFTDMQVCLHLLSLLDQFFTEWSGGLQ